MEDAERSQVNVRVAAELKKQIQKLVDVRVVKGDGSSRELRVVLVADEMRVVQDRVTEAPYGVVMFRVVPG